MAGASLRTGSRQAAGAGWPELSRHTDNAVLALGHQPSAGTNPQVLEVLH